MTEQIELPPEPGTVPDLEHGIKGLAPDPYPDDDLDQVELTSINDDEDDDDFDDEAADNG